MSDGLEEGGRSVKYKVYRLLFLGDKEVVALLDERVSKQWDSLGQAREAGRAAVLLFGVKYKVVPITRPKPAQMGTVQSL